MDWALVGARRIWASRPQARMQRCARVCYSSHASAWQTGYFGVCLQAHLLLQPVARPRLRGNTQSTVGSNRVQPKTRLLILASRDGASAQHQVRL
jgi:hypothetical protein